MTTGQASLFEERGREAADESPESRRPREEFLTGLLATWLAGVGAKPTKEQRALAAGVAKRTLSDLHAAS